MKIEPMNSAPAPALSRRIFRTPPLPAAARQGRSATRTCPAIVLAPRTGVYGVTEIRVSAGSACGSRGGRRRGRVIRLRLRRDLGRDIRGVSLTPAEEQE